MSLSLLMQGPAAAGLLSPLLRLFQPRLEERLTRVCLAVGADGRPELERRLEEPCRRLARPASACLIEETERSGRSFGVLTELASGRVGDDSEVVVKRCAARLLGLPADTLQEVPLKDLQRRFSPRPAAAEGNRVN
jgi:hypothetical protein